MFDLVEYSFVAYDHDDTLTVVRQICFGFIRDPFRINSDLFQINSNLFRINRDLFPISRISTNLFQINMVTQDLFI